MLFIKLGGSTSIEDHFKMKQGDLLPLGPRNQGKTCARPRAMSSKNCPQCPQRRTCGLRAKAKAVTEQTEYQIWDCNTCNTLSPQPSSNGGTGFMFCLCMKVSLYSARKKWSPNGQRKQWHCFTITVSKGKANPIKPKKNCKKQATTT